MKFEPLRVEATLANGVMLPRGVLALDALLASVVAIREDLPPPLTEDDIVPIEIPVKRSKCGRYHLASFGVMSAELYEPRRGIRRPVVEYAKEFGGRKVRSLNLKSGADKPTMAIGAAAHVENRAVVFWCVGDKAQVEALLGFVTHLGKRRGVGLGRVLRWAVEPVEPWGKWFPVVSPDGKPLRNLPVDHPGVDQGAAHVGYDNLTYPYWRDATRCECYVPEPMV